MASDKIRAIIGKNKELKRRKNPWLAHFQLIGEYILTRKQSFTVQQEQGAFLTRELFDNTGSKSNDVMASALIGSLWPNGAKSFRVIHARKIPDSPEVKSYFDTVSGEMAAVMDDSRAGLTIALDEYMKDQGSFGTSGIGIFKNPKGPLPIRYKAWNVKTMSIDENENGFVDTIYNETEKTVRKVVLEYGIENVSKKTRELFENGKIDSKVRVLHAIEPRIDADPLKFGNKDMPIASIHIELGSEKILRESGFEEMPVPVTRFLKALGEIYGRSSGMAALPDIVEINAIWEATTVAIEKAMDPPLGMLSDGDLGPAVIDTSAGAINVFNVVGRAGKQQPIFPLFTVGEIQNVVALIEKRTQAITEHFFIDRLLDLNNDTRMTLGEAQLRNELRAASLGSIFARQEAEMFTPLITRTFNLLLEGGHLGVIKGSQEEIDLRVKGIEPLLIPESVARAMINGEEVFDIKYISPAKRAMQAEEVQGILASWNFTTGVAKVVPAIMDNLDPDISAQKIARLTGAPEEIVRSTQAIKDLRTLRAAELEKAEQMETLRQASEIARNAGQAQSALVGSDKGGA